MKQTFWASAARDIDDVLLERNTMDMQEFEAEPIVAFNLAHYPGGNGMAALARLAFDRFPLASTPGLRFRRVLGVGKGRVFNSHADLQRSALFTVWDSYAALKRFESSAPVMQRIRRRADELWTVHMRPVRWHGEWGGRDPFAGMSPVPPPEPGPWLILTRATLRPARVPAFLRAVPAVAEHLARQPACIKSVGVGEAPLLYQATISLWKSLPAITAFAYGAASTPHSQVIRRTRREGWYSEELFARFRPLASWGTWDGEDPLAGL
jgi:heme-degrading monooxygenase HmoA